MPGGSSNLYLMMHIRGHASDYDNWAYNGCPGWSYEECLPVLREAGGSGGRHQPDGPARAARSTVINAKHHDPNPTSEAFIEACLELGYPPTDDFNGPNMEGDGLAPHQRQGRQAPQHEGGATSTPAPGGTNLTLSTHSQATRLLFEGGTLRRRRVRPGRRAEGGACDARGDRLRRRDRVAPPAAALRHRRRRSTCASSGSTSSSTCRAWARTSTTTCSPA